MKSSTNKQLKRHPELLMSLIKNPAIQICIAIVFLGSIYKANAQTYVNFSATATITTGNSVRLS